MPPSDFSGRTEATSQVPLPRAGRHYHALDGLRGIAILMVMLCHYALAVEWNWSGSRAVNFGWMGVDVFFVLSGFLVTGILLDTLQERHFFRTFYARRLLRIVPVYYLFLIIVFVGLPFLIPFNTPEMHRLVRNQGWLWGHLTNWGFVYGSLFLHERPFTGTAYLNITHLWSLAVEEQFYLFWPLIVWVAGRTRLKWVCWGCIIGAVALRTGLWAMHQGTGAMYLPTPCRLDGLALGALVAALIREPGKEEILRRYAPYVGLTSLVLLGALAVWRKGLEFTDPANVAVGIALINFLSASVVVMIIRREDIPGSQGNLQRALMNKPLRSLGKYSYGLYLYHTALLGLMQYYLPPEKLAANVGNWLVGNAIYLVIFFTISLGFAVVSWQLFEKQVLKLKRYFEYKTVPPSPLEENLTAPMIKAV